MENTDQARQSSDRAGKHTAESACPNAMCSSRGCAQDTPGTADRLGGEDRPNSAARLDALRHGLLLAGLSVTLASAAIGIALLFTRDREPWIDWSQRTTPVALTHPIQRDDAILRFAVATMVNAETTFAAYRRFVQEVSRQVGRTPAFVLHGSYAETRRELEGRRLDVALVCTGTYVLCTDHVVLLAQPEFADGLLYRSVVLVPRSSPAHSFTDLEGTVMGFTDPESNTGCLVPTDLILNQKTTPERFFRKVVFTGSHDRSIRAAALGIVDAVAVDSLVWCPTAAQAPRLADRLRVLWESPSFGPPPIVAPATIDQALKHALQETLLHLHETAEGSRVLRELGIIRFVAPRPEDYRSASELAARVRQR